MSSKQITRVYYTAQHNIIIDYGTAAAAHTPIGVEYFFNIFVTYRWAALDQRKRRRRRTIV